MKKLSKKYLALILSVMLIVCSLPLTTVAATAPALKISSNVTNGVEDENVSLDYMVVINGEAFNGVVRGSDSNDYTVTDGKLTLPYNVTASIDVNDGDSYSVQRLAYSSGKYRDVEESDVQTGTISTTTYYVTVDGEKSEISQSEYNSATDNGNNTSLVLYSDSQGVTYTEDKVEAISGYTVKRSTGISTTYSLNEYSGYYLKSSMEEHSLDISDVSCTHSRNNNWAGLYNHSNSLTSYFDDVADEPKTSSSSNVVSVDLTKTNCKNEFSSNSMRAYYDHAIGYEEQGLTAVLENNGIVECSCTASSLSKGASANGEYTNPVVENTLYVFESVTAHSYEYSSEEKEDPSASCVFDIQLIIPTATLKVEVGDCQGNAITGVNYYVTDANKDIVELYDNKAVVTYGEYKLTVENVPEDYKLSYSSMSVTVMDEEGDYTLSSVYHKPATELSGVKAPKCEEDGYSGDTVCALCNTVLKAGRPISMTGHTYSDFTYIGDGESTHCHTALCDNGCGNEITQDCEFTYSIITPPTYEDEGEAEYRCNDCGYSYTVVLPVNTCSHENTRIINDVEARCGVQGYTGDTFCDDCSQIIATGETTQALTHSFTNYAADGETEDGYTHTAYCDNGCGEADTQECVFDYAVTLEPTKKTDGVGTYTCQACGYAYDEVIPALGYGSITIGANVTANGIEIDADVKFSYYVMLNGVGYNGEAIGSDGNSYTITDGLLVLPYDVTAVIDEIDNDTSYSVKLLTYDNEKYALVNESDAEYGDISTKEYYVNINDNRKKVTASQFNRATNNGENLVVDTYIDSAYNQYEEVNTINGYEVERSEILGSTSYLLEQYTATYAEGTLSQRDISIDASCEHTRTDTIKFGVTLSQTHKVDTTVSGEFDGSPTETKTSDASNITSAKDARSKCDEIMQKDVLRTYYDATSQLSVDSSYAIVAYDNTTAPCEVSFDEQGTKTQSRDTVTNTVYSFTPVTSAVASYDIVNVKTEKSCTFDVTLAPAPTGSFAIDFIIYQGTVPEAFDQAEFSIKSENGVTLNEGSDYTLTVENKSVDLVVSELGYTLYKFDGLKAGNYTITQTKTADGFILDTNNYSFNVARADGAVTGDNFAKSDFDSKNIALTNSTYSLVKSFKVFKNNCYTIDFTTLDQNDEPVEGAKFIAVERDEFLSLVMTLLRAGVSSIGSTDIGEILQELQNTDWQNIDASTIINIILSIVNLDPSALGDITLPAILTTTSDENGLVSLSNTSNMLNILGAITENGITGAQLAEVLNQYFQGIITEDMQPLLDALASMTGNINVHTGMPAGAYILTETEAPTGYRRNGLVYTMSVSATGTAVASAGIVIPVIVDTINTEFGLDLREILINEEEFNKIKETVGSAFDSFTDYSNAVIDNVVDFLSKVLGEDNATSEVLNNIKDKINDYNDQYDDLAFAIGQTIKDINSMITDEMTEEWVFITPRIFVDINIIITDCNGNNLDGLEAVVYDSEGYYVTVKNNVASAPFGTYTSEVISDTTGYYPCEEGNYIVKSGSTIVELTPKYLATLSIGVHTLGIRSNTGLAETEFEIVETKDTDVKENSQATASEQAVAEKEATNNAESKKITGSMTSPETGAVYSTAGVVAGFGVIALLVLLKRRENEER